MADDTGNEAATSEIEMPAEYVGQGVPAGAPVPPHTFNGIPGVSGPVTTPGQAPIDSTNVGGVSASVVQKGLSPGQLDLVQNRIKSPMEREIAAEVAPVDQRYASDVATANRDYAALGGVQQQIGTQESDFYNQQRELLRQRQNFEKSAAELEQRLAGDAMAQREEYLNAYREQLAGVRVLMAQSGNPLNNLSGAQAGGLALARFAEGFLAAGGIKIDVGSQVDRWVDRSIQEHQQDIANARNLATDQLHLYEIARQSSQDDWESRQRYRGFVLQGLATSMEMNAARFQSQLATSKALETAARLKIEADATERAIGDRHEATVLAIHRQKADEWYRMGELALKQKEVDLRAKALQAKQPADIKPFYDPSTGRLIGVIRGGEHAVGVEEDNKQASSAQAGYAQLKPLMNRAVDLYNQAGAIGALGDGWQERTDEKTRELKATLQRIAEVRQLWQSGKSSTDVEYKRILEDFPREYKYQMGNNSKLVVNFLEDERSQYEAYMKAHTRTPTAEEYRGFAQEPPRTADPALKSAYQINNLPATENPPVKSVGAEEGKLAVNLAEGARVSTEGGKFSEPGGFFDASKVPNFLPSSKAYSTYSHDEQQPSWSVAVEHLALAAVSPKTFRDAAAQPHPEGTVGPVGEIPKDDDLLAREGIGGLKRLAEDKKHKQVASYAAHLLELYESNPNELRQLIDPWAK